MIRPHLPLSTRYVDYGKVFVPNGALDFSTLAFSDPEVAPFGPQLFNRGLVFPDTSPFASQIGRLSAALLMFEGGYLFTLVQRRREGELSTDPRTDRPFNQVRFILLTREVIEQAFAARAGLYTGLALAARHPEAHVWLKDYTTGGQLLPWSPQMERLDPAAPDPAAIRFVTNALVNAAQRVAPKPGAAGEAGPVSVPQPISIPLPGDDLMEKLQLVEAVQYWALPRLGVFSFALDYVSVQNVHLRLFPLPDDAPAPLPPERVFAPGPIDARFVDDYYSPVSALQHEALYDPALASLLALDVTTAEATALYQVEKQAEPLSGPDALRLYPELARLGERRFSLLRRVPRADALELLRQADLPADLRLDLLQAAFDADHGLLWLYAPAHLAVPRAARDDERLRVLLRASLAKSPDSGLGLVAAADQAEFYYDLLLARRVPPAAKHQPDTISPLAVATGQSLLEVLLMQRRGPALAEALQAAVAHDTALFGEALTVLDRATDLPGMLWLWRAAGQGDLRHYTAVLDRVVQPAWYAELARDAGAWRALLADGRALAAGTPEPDSANAGSLLHALPRDLVPFVWQASLHVAEHDAAFGDWWLFNEALALPEQLPELWRALQRLPVGALGPAGPALGFLLGREKGLSLLKACTPPGYDQVNEALFATVLTAWQETGFRSLAGDLALATEDIELLLQHLPGSNTVLAAIANSPVQAPAISGLPAQQALRWAQATHGDLRQPYRSGDRDALFARLIELPDMNEALLWHLLVEDEGTAPAAMPWAAYAAVVGASEGRLDALQITAESRLRAYLSAASALENPAVAEVFRQSQIDLRRVLALLALGEAGADTRAADEIVPLAAFHLQETSPVLRARAAGLLRATLERTDVTTYLTDLPDTVLEYLRTNFCDGQPAREAAGHWIEAELSRRKNAYRLEALLKPPPLPRSATPQRVEHPVTQAEAALSAPPPAAVEPVIAPVRLPRRRVPARPAVPAPPPPQAEAADTPEQDPLTPLLGELALPTSAPKKSDSATWLWVAIILILLVMVAIVIGVVVYLQSLQPAPALSRLAVGLVSLTR